MQITKGHQVVCVLVFISVKLRSFANHLIRLDQLEIKETPGLSVILGRQNNVLSQRKHPTLQIYFFFFWFISQCDLKLTSSWDDTTFVVLFLSRTNGITLCFLCMDVQHFKLAVTLICLPRFVLQCFLDKYWKNKQTAKQIRNFVSTRVRPANLIPLFLAACTYRQLQGGV